MPRVALFAMLNYSRASPIPASLRLVCFKLPSCSLTSLAVECSNNRLHNTTVAAGWVHQESGTIMRKHIASKPIESNRVEEPSRLQLVTASGRKTWPYFPV
ncbi:hypothetical protein F4680DRAFT_411536 [Xylaria scruposa]|nr:hypothetical protein F4680DRAFT_411536 [Xylaria scruposa]